MLDPYIPRDWYKLVEQLSKKQVIKKVSWVPVPLKATHFPQLSWWDPLLFCVALSFMRHCRFNKPYMYCTVLCAKRGENGFLQHTLETFSVILRHAIHTHKT